MGLTGEQVMTAEAVTRHQAGQPFGVPRHLYGPVVDFLCLGGVSFLLFPIVVLLPQQELAPAFAATALAAAHAINHPHFAFSYQIFYEGFLGKAFGAESERSLRARYVFAGIVVPLALVAFFAAALLSGDARTLGQAGNVMSFLVGWHYVKQGYGMLMVDAALKRQYFDAVEKRVLLVNCYALWALSWLSINSAVSERGLWGLQHYTFDVPTPVLGVAVVAAVTTSVMTLTVFVTRWRANGGRLPVNGVAAYVVSLYLWQLMMNWNLLWLLMVPALHSLQYMVVTSRYRTNRLKDAPDAQESPRLRLMQRLFARRYRMRFCAFLLLGLAFGYAGFWGVPEFLQKVVPYDHAVFGPTAFLFVFWIFINVHHYFLDNVMWRSSNPDIRKYLFS